MAITIAPSTLSVSVTTYSGTATSIERSEFEQDLDTDLDDVFFGEDEFVYSVTVAHDDGTTDTVRGIFDAEGRTMDLEGDEAVILTEPQFSARAKAFSQQPKQGELVTVRGQEYRVNEVHPDGTGVIVVSLLRD